MRSSTSESWNSSSSTTVERALGAGHLEEGGGVAVDLLGLHVSGCSSAAALLRLCVDEAAR